MLTTAQITTIDSTNLDNYVLAGAADAYTINNNYNYNYNTVSSISLDDITLNYDLFKTDYFGDSFPPWDDFNQMKDHYPAIDKAFNKLKELYDLCKDDWESLKGARF
jgi:hypothetical protein